jgi:uncharacterized protein YjbI with pentapeptide repeats
MKVPRRSAACAFVGCCVLAAWSAAAQSERRRERSPGQAAGSPSIPPSAEPVAPPIQSSTSPASSSTPETGSAIWTWKDGSGQTRSRADLETILSEHQQWLTSKKKQGTRANLSGADLSGADLTSANLREAELSNVKLNGAVLEKADLDDADLMNADLSNSDLQYAELRHADLYGAKLVEAQLGLKAIPIAGPAKERVKRASSQLPDALLDAIKAGRAIPEAARAGADLGHADLRGADLTNAWFRDADLDLAIYEPIADPNTSGIAKARHLDLATYVDDPEALVRLRKEFSETGFGGAENKITYAVNRKETADDARVLRWFRRVAFDWTCQYGMNASRPLKIIGLVWLAMSVFYFTCMHLRGPSGIYVEAGREVRGEDQNWRFQVLLPHLIDQGAQPKGIRKPGRRLRWEWRLTRAAMYFSLISAFNIGYQELNIGAWLKMLTKREYNLTAAGWARTAAGVQSLLSVYMLALWVLTFFGHPFE